MDKHNRNAPPSGISVPVTRRSAFGGLVGATIASHFTFAESTAADAKIGLSSEKAAGAAVFPGRNDIHTIQSKEGKVLEGLAQYLDNLPLYAGNFGVVGDGAVDDTAQCQEFLDLCASLKRTAYFGSLCCRITGPLTAVGTNIVFDRLSYGAAGDPGFLATFASGADTPYTALAVSGIISQFCVTVFGAGNIAVDDKDTRIIGDTREHIHGIDFGGVEPSQGSFAPNIGSWIAMARTYMLGGRGIRLRSCFDTTFGAISSEFCGSNVDWAFEIADAQDDLAMGQELTINRLQVERAVGRAIRVSPRTLSCNILKVHSERCFPTQGIKLWEFGGSINVSALRLQSFSPSVAVLGGSHAVYSSVRGESAVILQLEGTGGDGITLIEPAGTIAPVPGQIGRISIRGGQVDTRAISGGTWVFDHCRIENFDIGFNSNVRSIVARDCQIANLQTHSGQAVASATLERCVISKGAFLASETVLRDCRFAPSKAHGRYIINACKVVVDGGEIVGHATVENASLILKNGALVLGDLTILGSSQSLCDESSYVDGAVTGWSHPHPGAYLVSKRGMFCKNLTTGPGQPYAWICTASANGRAAGEWLALGSGFTESA